MTFSRLFSAGCVAATLALAGCAEILPGLNVSIDHDAGSAEYRVVQDSNGEYRAEPVHPDHGLPAYRIQPITAQLIVEQADERTLAQRTHETLPALNPAEPPPEYRVGAGDVVNVTVWDHPELTSPAGTQTQSTTFNGQLIDSDGYMYYPFAGRFHAAGMTAAELETYLTKALRPYIQDPQIAVRVVSFQSDRVEVTGEVVKPGTITLDNTAKGVLQAIDAAGGLAPDASRRRAILVRGGKRYVIDLAGLLSGNRVVPNPVLKAGDSIHIPDNSGDEVFLLGAIDKQQPVVMRQNQLTLLQALTTGGGMDKQRANDSAVFVFRLSAVANAPAHIYTLDLSEATGVFLAGHFELEPRDVVYVANTLFARYNDVINQILPTVSTVFQIDRLTTNR